MRDLLGRMLNEGQKVVINSDILPKPLVGTLVKVGGIPMPHPQVREGVVDVVVMVEVHLAMAAGTPVVPQLVICQDNTDSKNVIESTEAPN
jgi:hypothetical protein